jgi:tetratricopeptide (TPR) repeat protein
MMWLRVCVLVAAATASALAESGEALHLQGRELLRRSQLAAAVPVFERAAELEPNKSRHAQWLGRVYGMQAAEKGITAGFGGVGKVRTQLERAIELDPNNLEARHDLAVFYRVVPRILGGSRSKSDEQVAAIRSRDAALAKQVEGGFLARDKKHREALALYEESLRLNPRRARPHVSMATVYLQLEEWERAFSSLDRALAAEPQLPLALYQFGRAAAMSGRRLDAGEKALRTYLAMRVRRPEHEYPPLASAHHRLGMILQSRGNTAAARAELQRALKYEPDNKDVRAALSALD